MANQLAYFLIDREPVAIKMTVAWPTIPLGLKEREIMEEWSRLTGEPIAEIKRLAPVLWENEICLLDGTVDKTVWRVLSAKLAGVVIKTQVPTGKKRGEK